MSRAPHPTVVVSGLPRSGTSLLMQMLAAAGLPVHADDARRPDLHNPRGYLEHASVRGLADDPSLLDAARGRAVKVVAPLVRALPEVPASSGAPPAYRVIFVERDLDEVLASQAAMLARRVRPPEADPAGLRDALAHAAATSRDALAARRDVALHVVAHATLLADPARAARELAAFLAEDFGALDPAAMAAAVDPALHRQRARRASLRPGAGRLRAH